MITAGVGPVVGDLVGLAVVGVGANEGDFVGLGVPLQISGLHTGPHGPFENSFETKEHAAASERLPPSEVCFHKMRAPHVA